MFLIDCVGLYGKMLFSAVLLMFQEGATDEEIERLPKFKFMTVRNSEKVNGEIRETHGGIMTQLGVDSPPERVLSSDEAVS